MLHAFVNDHAVERKNALTTVPVIKPEPETVKSTPMETASAVTCVKVVFDEETNRYLLFVGDEQGSIGIWDPTVMMQRLSLAKIPEIKCKYLRRGYQPKAMFFRDFLKDTSGVDGSYQIVINTDRLLVMALLVIEGGDASW
ncbi:hypothetical protein GQ600_15178 [Phytophthora cactorum]|nr:hypothetical protein GQ600_15178 [Phytophthora cactorum]